MATWLWRSSASVRHVDADTVKKTAAMIEKVFFGGVLNNTLVQLAGMKDGEV